MTKILFPFPVFRAFDDDAAPLVGGQLYTYAAGTLTPLATFTDETGDSENTNPVILDDTGSANVWLGSAPYKMVLKDANDVVQWTVDNIGAKPPTIVNVVDYGAVGDGGTDDQPAFAAAAGAAGSWGTVLVPRPAVSYNLGSNVSDSVFWIFMGSVATSGVGTLTGIQIKQVSGGSLAIVNPSGSNALSLDNAGNWTLTGTSFELTGGDVTVTESLILTPLTSYLKWFNSVFTYAFDYGITNANSLSYNDDQHSISFAYGLELHPAGNDPATAPRFTVMDDTLFKGYYGTNLASINNGYVSYPGGVSGQTNYGGIFLGQNKVSCISFNDGSSSANTAPTNDYQIGVGHNFINGGSGFDNFFIMKKNGAGATQYGTVFSIDSNGCVGLGCPPAQAASSAQTNPGLYVKGDGSTSTNVPLIVNDQASGATSQKTVSIRRGGTGLGTEVGSISTTSSATAFNTSSDYRLKTIVAPIDKALAEVNKVLAYTFSWKLDGALSEGFLAHEVQDIAPYAVNGEKDAVDEHGDPIFQQVDYSKLVPLLWAAVQELSAKVKQLEAKGE